MNAPEPTTDGHALTAPGAGGRAIRGGAIRTAGYGVGLVLTAAASIPLLRHLGVVRFGQYTTVIAIVTVVQGVTDAGLTLVGQREYVHADAERRRTLLADLVGIRLLLTPLGVLLGVVFAIVAGYPNALVTGTVLAGIGVVLSVARRDADDAAGRRTALRRRHGDRPRAPAHDRDRDRRARRRRCGTRPVLRRLRGRRGGGGRRRARVRRRARAGSRRASPGASGGRCCARRRRSRSARS